MKKVQVNIPITITEDFVTEVIKKAKTNNTNWLDFTANFSTKEFKEDLKNDKMDLNVFANGLAKYINDNISSKLMVDLSRPEIANKILQYAVYGEVIFIDEK